MTIFKSACVALTAVLCAASMSGSAVARGGSFSGGHMGGGHAGGFSHAAHVGHVGHDHGHVGHDHDHFGHHHHFNNAVIGFGLYDPYSASYYDDSGDCYRVYRNHHWRTVCD